MSWVANNGRGGGVVGRDPFERFREKYIIDSKTGCFEWQGALNSRGYGSFSWGGKGKSVLAHRWAWEHVKGAEIPKGKQLDHLCNNKKCVNTDHMRTATPRENTLAAHSNTPSGINSRATHCRYGHAFEGYNVIARPDGRRQCRECQRAHALRNYYKTKERKLREQHAR